MISALKNVLKQNISPERYERIRGIYWELRSKNFLRSRLRKFRKHLILAFVYPAIYYKNSKKSIDEHKVIFIEPEYKHFSNNFHMIYNKLNDNYDYDLHIHILQSESRSKKEYYTRRINMIRDIATARYVFIDVGTDILGRIHFREETQIVQLWHACGAFKKFGLSTADLLFGATRKEMERYPVYKYCSFVSVSSPEITWAYSEAMGIDESKIKPWGVSRTDVLFREDFRTAAKKKFELFMPSSRGKKVILFAPTFRGRVASAKTSVAFSIPLFFDALSDEYVLVIKHHPHIKRPPVIPKNYQQFAVDFTNVMDIEELLCVADICISDYSSLVFEYSLFEKPMLFFAYDLDEYFDWRGFYYNYEELTPGPVFKTNLEMIDYIKHIDERFDREKVIAFRNKFMSACDGHSTERIMKHVFGDSLENHIKIGAIEKMDVSHANDITLAEPDNHNTGLDTRSKLIENYPDIAGKKS